MEDVYLTQPHPDDLLFSSWATSPMNPSYLGDSYDLVKRFFLAGFYVCFRQSEWSIFVHSVGLYLGLGMIAIATAPTNHSM